MNKKDFYFFKKGLMLIIPIAVFTIVKDLFEVDLYNLQDLVKLLMKGLFVGTCTGFILGVLNIFFKMEIFKKS